MKYIKLDGRHTLYRRGYRYAFVFKTYAKDNPSEWTIQRLVSDSEGMTWRHDNTFYGKRPSNGTRRPYYIGFNDLETAMLVQLQL